jgi:hypothetical protein
MPAFRVMSWNVENLFLPSSEDPTSEDGPTTTAAFEAKLRSLASLIDATQPDVAALQEIGPDVIDRLQAALGHRMDHSELGEADERGIRVALLATRPLHDSRQIRQFPRGVRPVQAKDEVFDDPLAGADEAVTGAMGRSALEGTIRIGGEDVIVVTAHFKSKLINYTRKQGVVGGSKFAPNNEGERLRYAGYALFRRAGESMTIRSHLDSLLADNADPPAGLGRDRAVEFSIGVKWAGA